MAVSDQAVLTGKQLDTLSINTIRTLSIDAVQKANSGHPGAPMAFAPVAYVLWQQFLRYDPANPVWPNRDRFILSNGHASALLYSMLYLSEVKSVSSEYKVLDRPSITIDDLKSFRQLDSRTPGHPEYRVTSGVETTTGPLGQGIGNSVGMSMASNWLKARYNQPGFEIFDYNIYAF
jgi:transketolase